jgi:hypothetical protein
VTPPFTVSQSKADLPDHKAVNEGMFLVINFPYRQLDRTTMFDDRRFCLGQLVVFFVATEAG